ncbi:cytochrome c2 [Altererythrobacter atlanticus]|uniref:Cytochrome c2 iso-2 n=1 Tax=Croceibacterium atlanticum TaxID=1267766 RepID=A0A0F7KTC3_9SPHN|nr:c-type cytochrome [Croceibacterium atlanticum]AKH43658.1 Cytochrome c2 iso-2 [Croceibacterium atlanticum]MBB5733858.1 cytochrome c2 [Croceibacterium atlanticum]
MKFDRTTIAPLALAFALAACGGGAEEADDPALTETPEVTEAEAAPEDIAAPVEEEAAAEAEAVEEEVEETTAAPEPEPKPTASATPAAKPSPAAAAAAPSGPPQAFVQCSVCHSTEPGKNGIGPSLAGIYGTKAGEVAGFKFSPAMLESGLTWDEATLDRYLKDPRKVVPGTIMGFGGVKDDAKRKAIVDYVKSL